MSRGCWTRDLAAEAFEVLRTHQPAELELHSADERTCFIVRLAPYRTVRNKIAGVVITFINVSDLKHTEQLRIANEQRFCTLFESNMVGVLVGTTQGDVTEANEYYLRLIGYSRADLQSGSGRWNDLTPAEYLAVDAKALAGKCGVGNGAYRG